MENAIIPGTRNCKQCGDGFIPAHSWSKRRDSQRFCSKRCSGIYNMSHVKERQCEYCGNQFDPINIAQRYCRVCVPNKQSIMRMTRYGLSNPDWLAMVDRYDGLCWVCKEQDCSFVDHDHNTNVVRGAVCPGCNTKLAAVDKDGWLDMALVYLSQSGTVLAA